MILLLPLSSILLLLLLLSILTIMLYLFSNCYSKCHLCYHHGLLWPSSRSIAPSSQGQYVACVCRQVPPPSPALKGHKAQILGPVRENLPPANAPSPRQHEDRLQSRRFWLYDKVCTLVLTRYRLLRVRQTFLQ